MHGETGNGAYQTARTKQELSGEVETAAGQWTGMLQESVLTGSQ